MPFIILIFREGRRRRELPAAAASAAAALVTRVRDTKLPSY